MFGKKKIKALQERVAELEMSLQSEKSAHEAVKREMNSLREDIEAEKKSLFKQQSEYKRRLAVIDEQAETYLGQMRAALAEELSQERANAREKTLDRVKAFSDNYTFYLSQLTLMMQLLTKAAMNTGEVFLLDENVDTEQMFRSHLHFDPDAGAAKSNAADTDALPRRAQTIGRAETTKNEE